MVCLIFNLCKSYNWIKPSKLITYKFKTSPNWKIIITTLLLTPRLHMTNESCVIIKL